MKILRKWLEVIAKMRVYLSQKSAMPDNLKRRRPLDSSRINLNQPHEVGFWTRRLKVSKHKLWCAVEAVGTSADAVASWLRVEAVKKRFLAKLRKRRDRAGRRCNGIGTSC